ncbi:unnamed protein product [Fraxinus pennsylvanica]|uniref:Uncharacterized protein n=1 Tax=Fraxinus pennsylvanica TaxID=56036 RepID=A0AAD1ZES8_9LAMI|nr:unnamed protein product [Fraxinus pennsylvanica]
MGEDETSEKQPQIRGIESSNTTRKKNTILKKTLNIESSNITGNNTKEHSLAQCSQEQKGIQNPKIDVDNNMTIENYTYKNLKSQYSKELTGLLIKGYHHIQIKTLQQITLNKPTTAKIESLTKQHNDDCKKLLTLMGVPVIEVLEASAPVSFDVDKIFVDRNGSALVLAGLEGLCHVTSMDTLQWKKILFFALKHIQMPNSSKMLLCGYDYQPGCSNP